MTTLEFAYHNLRKAQINLQRAIARKTTQTEIDNLNKKIQHYKNIIAALERD